MPKKKKKKTKRHNTVQSKPNASNIKTIKPAEDNSGAGAKEVKADNADKAVKAGNADKAVKAGNADKSVKADNADKAVKAEPNEPSANRPAAEGNRKRDRKYMLRKTLSYTGAYLAVAPFFMLFAVFTVIPAAVTFASAFTDFNIAAFPPRFVGTDNFRIMFFGDEAFAKAVRNTVGLIPVAATGYVLSFLIAWLINKLPRFFRPLFIFTFFIPALSGGVQFFAPNCSESTGIALLLFQMSFGAGFLAICAGLTRIPRERYEAAATEGMRNFVQELFYITVPAMKPYLAFSAVFHLAAIVSADGVYGMTAYALEMGLTQYKAGYAGAVSSVLFAAAIIAYCGIRILFGERKRGRKKNAEK